MLDLLFKKTNFVVYKNRFLIDSVVDKITPSLENEIRERIRETILHKLWPLENRIREYFFKKEN